MAQYDIEILRNNSSFKLHTLKIHIGQQLVAHVLFNKFCFQRH